MSDDLLGARSVPLAFMQWDTEVLPLIAHSNKYLFIRTMNRNPFFCEREPVPVCSGNARANCKLDRIFYRADIAQIHQLAN